MEYRRDDLLFLKKRIKEINVALFKAESDSVLQLPQ